MKLKDMLNQCESQFPVIGHNGYSGEQDGNNPEFLGVIIIDGGRNDCPDIDVPDFIKVHWCRHINLQGVGSIWEISLAYWPLKKNSDIPEALMKLCH